MAVNAAETSRTYPKRNGIPASGMLDPRTNRLAVHTNRVKGIDMVSAATPPISQALSVRLLARRAIVVVTNEPQPYPTAMTGSQ